jgi:predicted permease
MSGWDLRLAMRRVLSRPGYCVLLVAITAVGIGSATTVFSVVDQLMLRPAPFAFADRLVEVLDTNRKTRGGGNSLTPEKIAGWQAQPALFERFEASAPAQFDLTGDGEPERVSGLVVSVNLFPMLGVQPRLGRGFAAPDGRPGADRVVIVSDDLWRRRFGATADVLGRRVTLNDDEYTIVGVMPRRFRLIDEKAAVWVPYDVAANIKDDPRLGFYGWGRLARGVRFADAAKTADAIADHLQQQTPIARSWDLRIEPMTVAYVNPVTRTALLVVLGAVTFVLLITCANVATLLLSQAPLRVREMAIRSALGAGRARLFKSVLLESVVLAAAGGALGILLARWGVRALLAIAPARFASGMTTTIEVDARVVGVAIALTLVTGVLTGLLPAIRGSRPDLEATLRGTSAAARGSFGFAPGALVALEVSFSVVLLVGTALMARTLLNLEAITPGFEPAGLVSMHIDLPSDRYPSAAARAAFFETLFERLRSVPGISDATLAYGVPPEQGGFTWGKLEAEGRTPETAETIVPMNTVWPSYFRTLGISIVAGRGFEKDDVGDDRVIVSKGLADRLWPGGAAVGQRFRVGPTSPWRTVVGVAANVETRSAGEERTSLALYYPWRVSSPPAAATVAAARPRRTYAYGLVIVRAADAAHSVPAIKRQVAAIDSQQPVDRVALVTDLYAEAFARQRFVLILMSAFSVVAVALTAAGLVGVLAQVVARRTREIGVRMALGARPADVLRLIGSQGLAMTLAGALAGLGTALWLSRGLRALLFGIAPTDPVSFAAVAVFLVLVGAVASWIPARSATRIDPAVALRVE